MAVINKTTPKVIPPAETPAPAAIVALFASYAKPIAESQVLGPRAKFGDWLESNGYTGDNVIRILRGNADKDRKVIRCANATQYHDIIMGKDLTKEWVSGAITTLQLADCEVGEQKTQDNLTTFLMLYRPQGSGGLSIKASAFITKGQSYSVTSEFNLDGLDLMDIVA